MTVSYLPDEVVSGTYNVISYFPVLFIGIFIGDIVSGTNTITNCKATAFFGRLNISGYLIKNPYGGSKFIKILNVTGTTITFYGSITTTKQGAIFGNYTYQEIYTAYASNNITPAGYIVRKGDKVIKQKSSDNEVVYKVISGGFLSGDADPRQAQLLETT